MNELRCFGQVLGDINLDSGHVYVDIHVHVDK